MIRDPFAVTVYAPAQLIVSTRNDVGRQIVTALYAGHDVIVDLALTREIDAAALGMLLRSTREGKDGGRHVVLRGSSPELRRLFARAHAGGFLELEESA